MLCGRGGHCRLGRRVAEVQLPERLERTRNGRWMTVELLATEPERERQSALVARLVRHDLEALVVLRAGRHDPRAGVTGFLAEHFHHPLRTLRRRSVNVVPTALAVPPVVEGNHVGVEPHEVRLDGRKSRKTLHSLFWHCKTPFLNNVIEELRLGLSQTKKATQNHATFTFPIRQTPFSIQARTGLHRDALCRS